jgi:uncharacterized protein involved in outer membrane biogenesis
VEQADLRGARLQFYRDETGRQNWSNGQSNAASHGPLLRVLRVAGSRLHYVDEKRDRSLDVAVTSDAQSLRLDGTGLVMSHPVTVTARGAALVDGQAKGPWPYQLAIEGPAIGFALSGTMPKPLDLAHLEERRAAMRWTSSCSTRSSRRACPAPSPSA